MLTIKQERFAQEYIATGNASEAYRRAYDTRGNPATVAREAHSLVTHPKVAPHITALREVVSAHSRLTQTAVASQLPKIKRIVYYFTDHPVPRYGCTVTSYECLVHNWTCSRTVRS